MSHTIRRWMLGAAMLLAVAGISAPAEAQVVVRVGPHHRHYHHRHYRHGYRR